MDKSVKYFLGANTPYGFYGFYDHIANISEIEKMYILKGGLGTGKSEFIKKMAKKLQNENAHIELIPCSFDSKSLDGFIIKDKKIIFIDGTAPHCIDPKFTGAIEEIIDMGSFCDYTELKKNKQEIILLNDKISYCYQRAYRYLLAAQQLKLDSFDVIAPYIHNTRLKKLSQRLIKTEKFTKKSENGKIIPRFLTGITANGNMDSFQSLMDSGFNVYRLSDDYAIGTKLLLSIAQAAQMSGYLVYTCYCPMFPNRIIEHIIIPDKKLAFITCNAHHEYPYPCKRSINLNRYIDKVALSSFKNKLKLNKKLYEKLLAIAKESMNDSNDFYDILKLIYVKSMDFKKMDRCIDQLYHTITET